LILYLFKCYIGVIQIQKFFFDTIREKYIDLNYGREIILNWIGNYIRKPKKSKRTFKILDIGCGWGQDLTGILEISKNVDLYGIEIGYEKITACQQKNITIFNIDCEKDRIPVNDNFFDIIIINQFLEHTKEIFFICSEISRVLKKQGILIIGVPNLAAFHNRILLLFGYQPSCVEPMGPHVRGFTVPSLKNFISMENYFIVKEIKGSNFYPVPPLISKVLSNFFPQLSVSIFFLIERTSKEGLFIEILKKENFETNYYTGEKTALSDR
jgi:methionine biosynthesis protein MetW